MKKNHALDFLKVFFMLVIIFHHSSIFSEILVRGYVVVEFFFIASGYFLYNSYKNHNNQNTFQFIKRRFLKLYPCYLVAFIIMAVYLFVLTGKLPFVNATDAILEAIMIPVSPFYYATLINQPIWYLSVLLTASPIVYGLLRKIPTKLFGGISIITIIFVYALMIYNGGVEYWHRILLFMMPWWRGFADLLIGVLIAQIVENCSEKVRGNNLWGIVEAICFAGTIASMFVKLPYFDFVAFIFIIGLVISVTMKASLLSKLGNTKSINFLSNYEYEAYVCHTLIISLINMLCIKFSIPVWINLTAIFIGILVYSVIFKFFVDKGVLLINTAVTKIKGK